jgi:Lectin C-type domain
MALAVQLGCDAELNDPGFGFQVEFTCASVRADSDHLQLIIQQGGCDGPAVYDETISRGQAPKASDALAPGSYGFRALALEEGALVAEAPCVVSRLPDGDAVVLRLASDKCGSASAPVEPPSESIDASSGSPPGDSVMPPDSGEQASPAQDPVAVAPPPECSDTACACPRGCAADQTCENGACRPNQSLNSRCTAQRFQDHDYMFCGESLGWNAARRKCRSFGMGLVSIESAAENAFVRSHAGGVDRWIGANDLGQSDFNLFASLSADLSSGLRLGQDASCTRIQGDLGEGSWYWASKTTDYSNGAPLCAFATASATTCTAQEGQYQNWRADQPSNAGCICAGLCAPGEDCGLMRAADGSWDDQSCSFVYAAYVCESSP